MVLFYQAFTCEGWVCDSVALPAAVPVGLLVVPLLDWLDAVFVLPYGTAYLRNAYVVVPVVLGNMLFYYWLGAMIPGLASRVRTFLDRRDAS